MFKNFKTARIIHNFKKTYINKNVLFWPFVYLKNMFLTKTTHNSKICFA